MCQAQSYQFSTLKFNQLLASSYIVHIYCVCMYQHLLYIVTCIYITTAPKPTITTHPVNATVTALTNVIFTCLASESDVDGLTHSYSQHRTNGDIPSIIDQEDRTLIHSLLLQLFHLMRECIIVLLLMMVVVLHPGVHH